MEPQPVMAKLFCEAGAVISHFVFIAEIMVLGHLIFHAVVCYFDFFTQVDKYLLLQIYFYSYITVLVKLV